MGFVSHNEVFVHMQYRFLHGNHTLVGYLAKIVQAQAALIGMICRNSLAVGAQHTPPGKTVHPLATVDGLEVIAQAIEHRSPLTWGQTYRAGLQSGGVE